MRELNLLDCDGIRMIEVARCIHCGALTIEPQSDRCHCGAEVYPVHLAVPVGASIRQGEHGEWGVCR